MSPFHVDFVGGNAKGLANSLCHMWKPIRSCLHTFIFPNNDLTCIPVDNSTNLRDIPIIKAKALNIMAFEAL
jgi:hypothetical protein